MGRKSLAEAQKTRALILDIATRHFVELGYGKIALEEVAREGNMTRGAVYHHFGNKKKLFLAIVVSLLESMGEIIHEEASHQSNRWQSIHTGCRIFLEQSQNKAYQNIVMMQAPAILGTELWNSLDSTYTTNALRKSLERCAANNSIAISNAGAASEAISGTLVHLSRWVAQGNSMVDAQATLATVLNGFLAKSVPPQA